MPSRPAPVRYRVSLPEPQSHEIAVVMQVPALPGREVLRFAMPAWAPGSYMIRDFARHVYDLAVTDERGRPLPCRRLDKQRWEVAAAGRAVRVSYRVFAFEETVRTSCFDDRHAFWNGTSLFFYVEGELERPCEVAVQPPQGWRVSTALPAARPGGRTFRAARYDELADSPFEVGTIRPLKEGKPIDGEVVSMRPRKDVPLLFDVRVEVQQTPRATSDGPAQVASEDYRRGWDAIWGGTQRPASRLN